MAMITIQMHKNGFDIEGHANYAEHGKDVVCASVSTILQLAQIGLRILAKQYPSHIQIIEKDKIKESKIPVKDKVDQYNKNDTDLIESDNHDYFPIVKRGSLHGDGQ